MDLRSRLRKVAELVVELPPDELPEPASVEETPIAAPAAGDAATGMDDLDRRLAAQRANIAALGRGEAPSSDTAPTPTKTVEQIVRDASGPDLDAVSAGPAADTPPALKSDGNVDFAALYAQSNVPAAPFTAEQMLDMLGSLPSDLPLDTKRQTVKVTLGAMGKAIGMTAETIVADASRKLAALTAYSEGVAKQTAEFVAAGEFEIAALEKQIQEKRQGIEAARQTQSQVQERCHAEADRLDDVLEFFSLDVPPSRYAASPGGETGISSPPAAT